SAAAIGALMTSSNNKEDRYSIEWLSDPQYLVYFAYSSTSYFPYLAVSGAYVLHGYFPFGTADFISLVRILLTSLVFFSAFFAVISVPSGFRLISPSVSITCANGSSIYCQVCPSPASCLHSTDPLHFHHLTC